MSDLALEELDRQRRAALYNADVLALALRDLLKHYVELVESGDCGSWNPEGVSQVIQARAALRLVAD
jgi:hypothetical protein